MKGTDPRILHLVVSKKPFDMIRAGIKKEEYREAKPYWRKRLGSQHMQNPLIYFQLFDQVCFQHGYSRNAPRIIVKCKGIKFGKPNPYWTCGIVSKKKCYIIKIGEVIHG